MMEIPAIILYNKLKYQLIEAACNSRIGINENIDYSLTHERFGNHECSIIHEIKEITTAKF